MRNGKYAARRTSGTKAVSLLLAVLVLVGCSVGATLAWLTATSGTVTNTFTVGKVDITLQEHKYVEASNSLDTTANTVQSNEYKLIPGKNVPKDPFVTVKAGSEKCWLFVRIDEAELALDDTLPAVQYNADDTKWNSLILSEANANGVYFYYRIVDANASDQNLYVLGADGPCAVEGHKNGCVTINSAITSSFQNTPVLKFTAAAIQYDGLEVVDDSDSNTDDVLVAAKKAFEQLPGDFKSTTNLNTTTPVTPEI